MPEIQAMVDSFYERRQTGLIRLAYSPDKNLYLFLKRGGVFSAALFNSGLTQIFPRDQWLEKVHSAGEAYAKAIPLSPLGLLLFGLSLQVRDGRTEEISDPGQVSQYLKSEAGRLEPSLVYLNWQRSSGLVLFPEKNSQPYSVFVSEETVRDEAGLSPVFYEAWGPQCIASAFSLDASVDIWKEYQLRRLFAEICNLMLARFRTLAGRALVESLVRVMTSFTSERDLDISISSHKILDCEVFLSSEVAAKYYRLFLAEMFEHCAVVVGPRLLAASLRENIANLPAPDLDLIDAHALLPRGYFYD